MEKACVSVGYSHCRKNGHIPGGPAWMINWLPKGYAPTREDRLLAVFFDTEGRWSDYGLSEDRLPPLIVAIKSVIEAHLREHPENVAGHLESSDWEAETEKAPPA